MSYKWSGNYINNKPYGKGKLEFCNNNSNIKCCTGFITSVPIIKNRRNIGYQIILHGTSEIIYKIGKYTGQQFKFAPHGHGTMIDLNNTTYIGKWRKGKRHGQGTMTTFDNKIYSGTWANNKEHGIGRYITSEGLTYYGTWENGMRSGMGIQTLYDERKFEGVFKLDKPLKGILYISDVLYLHVNYLDQPFMRIELPPIWDFTPVKQAEAGLIEQLYTPKTSLLSFNIIPVIDPVEKHTVMAMCVEKNYTNEKWIIPKDVYQVKNNELLNNFLKMRNKNNLNYLINEGWYFYSLSNEDNLHCLINEGLILENMGDKLNKKPGYICENPLYSNNETNILIVARVVNGIPFAYPAYIVYFNQFDKNISPELFYYHSEIYFDNIIKNIDNPLIKCGREILLSYLRDRVAHFSNIYGYSLAYMINLVATIK